MVLRYFMLSPTIIWEMRRYDPAPLAPVEKVLL